ncbi:MAG: CotH kinase family protein [Lachnospiraceae bacterium]|nr:CotH kinase family protein [Lachnospiraceae bacterium]
MKKKKWLNTGLLLLFLAAELVLLYGLTKTKTLSNCSITAERFAALREGKKESPGLLKNISFGEEQLIHDTDTGLWYYSLPDGAAELRDPIIKFSAGVGARIVFSEPEITPESIAAARPLKFLVYTPFSCEEGSIVCTTLPLLSLDFDEEAISEEDDAPTRAFLTLIDNRGDAASRITHSDASVHVRGNMTREFPKKGFRLELTRPGKEAGETRENELPLLGLQSESDWILYAAYNDQEKVRNVFCSNLWKQSCAADNEPGYDTGMEYRYVELFLNNRYWGLYALGYPVSEKSIGLPLAKGSYGLYKATRGVTDENRIEFLDADEEDDVRLRALRPQMRGKSTLSFSQKWDPILEYYYEMYQNCKDDAGLMEITDLHNALDYYLFVNMTQGQDQASVFGYTNRYMLVFPDGEHWKALYLPWDMDRTWGNSPDTEQTYNTGRYAYEADYDIYVEDGPLHQMLLNGDPKIRSMIAQRWSELRSDVWSDAKILGLLNLLEADIYGSGAFIRDAERWPESFHNDAAEGLNTFRTYVLNRLHYVDSYYADEETAASLWNYTMQQEDFRPVYRFYSFPDKDLMTYWFKKMDGYNLLVQVNDLSAWDDERFISLVRDLGVSDAETASRPDMLVLQSGKTEHTVLQDFLINGTTADTVVGSLTFYESEGGYYGIYQDGKEVIVKPADERMEEPFRLIWFSPLVDDAGDCYDPHVNTGDWLFSEDY